MGCLNGSSCYLVGPIENDDDFGCDWRKGITPHLTELGIKVYNPLDRPLWIEPIVPYSQPNQSRAHIVDALNKSTNHMWKKSHIVIRQTCLRYVHTCDFVICRLNSTKTYGTTEELVRAKDLGKPILYVCSEIPSLWIWDILKDEYKFDSTLDLCSWLSELDQGQIDVDALKWIFMDDTYANKSINWGQV